MVTPHKRTATLANGNQPRLRTGSRKQKAALLPVGDDDVGFSMMATVTSEHFALQQLDL